MAGLVFQSQGSEHREGQGLSTRVSIGLVHDYLLVMRGGERTFAAIADCWPDASIYTLLYDDEGTDRRFHDRRVNTSYLQRLGIRQKGFRRLLPLFPHAAGSVKRTKLGDSDFRVLEVLLHKGPLPVNTIGPKVWLTPGSISVAVDRLVKKGLVSRKDHPDDRRVRKVELTPKGRALISRGFGEHAAAMEDVAGVLSKNERLTLVRLLKKLGKHAAKTRQ